MKDNGRVHDMYPTSIRRVLEGCEKGTRIVFDRALERYQADIRIVFEIRIDAQWHVHWMGTRRALEWY